MNESSKSRPYLITASVLDFLCTVAYFVVAVVLIISGLTAIAITDQVTDGSTAKDALVAVSATIMGTLFIILGVICLIAFIIALASAITGVIKVNKPIAELKKSTKLIKASYILNFIATGFFAMSGLGSIASISGEDFSAGGNGGTLVAGVAVILVIAAIRCACGVLKVKAVKIISDEDEQSIRPQSATFFGGEESSDN